MNKSPNLMFHEVLDDFNLKSGWHQESNGKYTITEKKFKDIIRVLGKSVNYTFDDGGISNISVSYILKRNNIIGIFFIPTSYIGKKGFMTLDQIKLLSKNHMVFSHSHCHLMGNFNEKDLFNDWSKSISVMKKNNLNYDTVCLPGGTFSKKHFRVFKKLGIKNVYHSAPSNFILNFLYGSEIIFYPRYIIDKNFKEFKLLNFLGLKSIIKQIINYFK